MIYVTFFGQKLRGSFDGAVFTKGCGFLLVSLGERFGVGFRWVVGVCEGNGKGVGRVVGGMGTGKGTGKSMLQLPFSFSPNLEKHACTCKHIIWPFDALMVCQVRGNARGFILISVHGSQHQCDFSVACPCLALSGVDAVCVSHHTNRPELWLLFFSFLAHSCIDFAARLWSWRERG